jgi:hypothetical protein
MLFGARCNVATFSGATMPVVRFLKSDRVAPEFALLAWHTAPAWHEGARRAEPDCNRSRRIRQSPFCELRLAAEARNPPAPGVVPGPKGTAPECSHTRSAAMPSVSGAAPGRRRPGAALCGTSPHAPRAACAFRRVPGRRPGPWTGHEAAAPGGPRHWPSKSGTRIRAAPALRWQCRRGRRLPAEPPAAAARAGCSEGNEGRRGRGRRQ